jgi:hypothetical protein
MGIHEYIENHRYGYNLIKGKIVKFEYYDFERDFINHIVDNRFSLVKKSRQMHATNLLSNYVAHKLLFGGGDNKIETIVYISNSRQDMSARFIEMVRDNILKFYKLTNIDETSTDFLVDRKNEIKLKNGNMIKGSSSSPDALRGFAPSLLIMDEAAFIHQGDAMFGAALTSLGTGGKAIMVSTPNGMDPLFYKTIDLSIKGESYFKILSINWEDNPKFNNSKWYDDICRSLNRHEPQIKQEVLGQIIFTGDGLKDLDLTNKVFYEPIIDYGRNEIRTYYSMDIDENSSQSGEWFDHYKRLINSLKCE